VPSGFLYQNAQKDFQPAFDGRSSAGF